MSNADIVVQINPPLTADIWKQVPIVGRVTRSHTNSDAINLWIIRYEGRKGPVKPRRYRAGVVVARECTSEASIRLAVTTTFNLIAVKHGINITRIDWFGEGREE